MLGFMRAMSVAKLKADFSKVLADVRRGECIGIVYGRLKEPVAMIVPYRPAAVAKREIGFLDGKVTIEFSDDYEMTDEELISHRNECRTRADSPLE